MNLNYIILLALLVLFCLISCSEGRQKRGGKKGVSKKGKGKRDRNPVKIKGEHKRKSSKKVGSYNKDDDEDDKKSKKKRKGGRKGRGRGGKKGGKKIVGGHKKIASFGKDEKQKGSKNKCRFAKSSVEYPQGYVMASKISGEVPCYEITCEGKAPKLKWIYKAIPCKTCPFSGINYMVGHSYENKCYGPGQCYAMVCMSDGTWQKTGHPCDDKPPPVGPTTTPGTVTGTGSTKGSTVDVTTTSVNTFKKFTVTGTIQGKTWKSDYADTSTDAFKELETHVKSKYESSNLSGLHDVDLVGAYQSSVGGIIEITVNTDVSTCGTDTSCLKSSVETTSKTFMDGVSSYQGSATTVATTGATTTVE